MDDYQEGYYASRNEEYGTSIRPIDVAKDRIEPMFPGLIFETAGGAVPFQASGTYLYAADFYFRFRGDSASLVIGRPERHVPANNFRVGKYPVTGDNYAGSLDNDEFVALFTELMNAALAETGLPRPE